MVVLSSGIYAALKSTLLKVISSGTALSHEHLATDFSDLDFNAAQSLYSQLLVREAKRKRCALDIVAAVTARRENGSSRSSDLHSPGPSLRDIAVKTGVSPFKIAKSYLSEVGIDFTEFMENPTAVVEEDIRFELLSCISDDPMCCTIVDVRKSCIGREFEEYLEIRLRKLNICFETENDLRSRGKPKTPDIVLMIPMALDLGGGKSCLVNWIDSKGMFADSETMLEHEQQLRGYVNRYGHGMVIYWYGYVEGLQAIDNVLVCDKFPSDWVFPTGERAESAAELSFDADIYTSSTLSATTCEDEYRLFGPTSRSLSSRVLSK